MQKYIIDQKYINLMVEKIKIYYFKNLVVTSWKLHQILICFTML